MSARGQGVSNTNFDVFDFIDPFIGTDNGGHVHPGATLPFGMVKASADVYIDAENQGAQGGFASDNSTIIGFSHMHDSGTGGTPSLGLFPIFPQSGCPDDDLNRCEWAYLDRRVQRINGTARASPGYFAVALNTSILGEVTVTNHTALYRFTFPDQPVPRNGPGSIGSSTIPLSPVLLLDLIDLPRSRSNGTISVDPTSGRISGFGTFNPSFGIGSYNAYVCADFIGAEVRDTGLFKNNRAGNDPKSQSVVKDGVNGDGSDGGDTQLPVGAFVQFNKPDRNNQIFVRVGMSFISIEKACQNAEKEIPTFDFEGVQTSAEDAWRKKLSPISIDATGVNDSLQTTFWSGVYRTFLSPQDYTGENPLWESDEPYYDSYYCIWDSYRSIHPLLTITDPQSQTLMIRSLIDIYVHEGYLPDCRMSLCKGFTQGGSNADVVLTDSFLKNITDGVDWQKGYEAVVKDAEVEPLNWAVEGRGGLKSWKELKYIPTDDYDPYGVGPFTRSISRTVEYAYNDFTIALFARGLGITADFEIYLERSTYWKNMYKADQVSFINETNTGFVGFLQPRFLNGTFGFQDPIFCSSLLNFTSCYLNPKGHETYEGSAWLYTFYVPQDMATLITTLGGPEEFTRRLQYLHYTYNLLYIGDEQAFLTVYLGHYSGRPGVSSDLAHFYIPAQFNDSIIGIPGNDDSGAMGSFSTFSMLGFFPVAGQDVYLIIPPFFPEINVTSPVTGRVATVRNIGFDPSYRARYIQRARLDGQEYTRNWIGHRFFLEGGVLELELGESESGWGTRPEDLPPSASTSFGSSGSSSGGGGGASLKRSAGIWHLWIVIRSGERVQERETTTCLIGRRRRRRRRG
ncbi:alpha-1,2-mannosidase, putative subfamily [Phyllosticta citriasiana]|uniref:Alpha-1,2-mannosidase, putative subfamily n=1 Tax=Phyllosticta citriasiana TaxID=595635 RepID=A0ABR1KK10_9PEZI